MKIEGVERFEEKLRHAEAELGIPEHGRVPVTYRRQSNLTRLIITLGTLSSKAGQFAERNFDLISKILSPNY